MFKTKVLAVILGINFLSGCGSAIKRADTLLEGDAFEEALAAYDDILKDEPSNERAIIGQKQARDKLLNAKLIEIRLSREGGNAQNSTDNLLKIVNMENEWKFFPRGAVAFTQEEETNYSFTYIKALAEKALTNNYPLLAESFLQKYKPIFMGNILPKFQGLLSLNKTKGMSKCSQFRHTVKESLPYYGDFVQGFCSHFGVSDRSVASNGNFKFQDLVKNFTVKMNVSGLPSELNTIFSEEIDKGLHSSVWYDPNGKSISKIQLQGQVKFSREKEEVQLIHEYTIQVPYTAYVPQMRTREVPYSAQEYQCVYDNNNNSICGNVTVTKYNTEYYRVNVPVTRYRSVPKQQPYLARKYIQNIYLELKGEFVSKPNHGQLALNEVDHSSDTEHDYNLPEIGLYPKKLSLISPIDWLKTKAGQLGQQFARKLDEYWEDTYCKGPGNSRSIASVGEQVGRCKKLHPVDFPSFVETWYLENLGVPPKEMERLLSK